MISNPVISLPTPEDAWYLTQVCSAKLAAARAGQLMQQMLQRGGGLPHAYREACVHLDARYDACQQCSASGLLPGVGSTFHGCIGPVR